MKGDKPMPFFDNFSKKVSEAAKTAAKKSGDLVETTKINMAINSEEDKIKAAYTEIGRTIYRKYSAGENVDGDVISSCQEIKGFEDNIASLREKISQIKNTAHQTEQPQYGSSQEAAYTPPQQSYAPPQSSYTPSQPMTSQPAAPQPQYMPQYIPSSEPVSYSAPQNFTPQEQVQQPQAFTEASQTICPSCGTSVAAGNKFCPSCGARL